MISALYDPTQANGRYGSRHGGGPPEPFPAFHLESTRRAAILLNVCAACLLVFVVPFRYWLVGDVLFPSRTSCVLEWAVMVPCCLLTAWIRFRRLSVETIERMTALLTSLAIASLAWDLQIWTSTGAPVPHGFTALLYLALMFVAGLRLGWVLTVGALVIVTIAVTALTSGQSAEAEGWKLYFDLLAIVFTLVAVRAQRDEAYRLWELQAQLRMMAFCDPLTGLSNRRHLVEATDRIFAQARREQKLVGVVVVDLDRFKALNDTHGHLMGDQALVRVAGILEGKAQRPMDVAARIGGDEFAIVWFDATPNHCRRACEQILHDVATASIRTGPGDEEVRLSTSVGWVCRPVGVGDTFEEFCRDADQGLYRHKRRFHGQPPEGDFPEDAELAMAVPE